MNPIASLAALALGASLSEIAAAADTGIPIGPPSPIVANNWSGLYVGVNLGGAWQSAPDWTYFNPNNGARFLLTSPDDFGAVGGLQGGYNWQSAALMLGVEGDISRTSLSQTRTTLAIGPGSFARMSAADDWLASVRGRVGFVGWNNTLFYVSGGVASSSIENNGHMTRFIGAAEYVADAASTTIGAGWVVGGGAEWMVDPHVVVRLEYLYYDLDNNPSLTGPISPGSFLPVTFTWSNYHVQVVRAGLSYKF